MCVYKVKITQINYFIDWVTWFICPYTQVSECMHELSHYKKKLNLNIKGQGCMKIVSRYYETFVVDERRIEDNLRDIVSMK